jgi:LemA protein
MNKTVKTLLIAALVIGVPIVIFMFYATGVYDKAVASDQTVKEKIGNVSSAYQRRADLFQNLVKVVKAAAKTEKEILVDVVRSRQGMDVVQQEPAQANPQMQQTLDSLGTDANMEKIASHENNFTKFRSGFNIVIERYPELKSIKNFQDLQTDITGTENRINTERNYYNEAVKEHNTLILGFFRQWALKFTGGAEKFKEYKPFEHKAGAEDAPDIDI